jgi:hypothetical protein
MTNIASNELADILVNYYDLTLLSCVYELNPLINSLQEQIKEILIDLEADKGVYITPAHYITVPMNEVGFAYMRDVAYDVLAIIQQPTDSEGEESSSYLFI